MENSDNTAAATAEPTKIAYRPVGFYLKDLSFESPKAPEIFKSPAGQPKMQLGVDVTVQKIEGTNFEVTLKTLAKAEIDGEALFLVEVTYAGMFAVNPEIGREAIEHLLLVDCAKDVFPFIRQIVAETTRSGGFAPLILDPVDFEQVYANRKQQAA